MKPVDSKQKRRFTVHQFLTSSAFQSSWICCSFSWIVFWGKSMSLAREWSFHDLFRNAARHVTSVHRIEIPSSVEIIANDAFSDCVDFTDIIFCVGNHVREINGFRACTALYRIDQIPAWNWKSWIFMSLWSEIKFTIALNKTFYIFKFIMQMNWNVIEFEIPELSWLWGWKCFHRFHFEYTYWSNEFQLSCWGSCLSLLSFMWWFFMYLSLNLADINDWGTRIELSISGTSESLIRVTCLSRTIVWSFSIQWMDHLDVSLKSWDY
jgi:hypothetical protein